MERKDLTRFYEFIDSYKKIQKIVFDRDVKTESILLKYSKYLTDNVDIENTLINLLKQNKQSLLVAAAGSGKTFIILDRVFKKIKFKDGKKHILVMTLPNKAQTEQVGPKYGVFSLVGNMNKDITEVVKTEDKIVSVYEKTADIEYLLRDPNIVVHFVIDEAHNIPSSSRFRVECIQNLVKIKNKVLENGGSVLLITASYESLKMEELDYIIYTYKNTEYEAPCESFNLYIKKNDKLNIENYIYKVVKNGIIRYNDITSYKTLINFYKQNKKKVIFANSKEKTYVKVDGRNKYNNETVNKLINEEILPENDICFITSMADAGINITNIENIDRKDYNSYFVVQNAENMSLANIEQFFNRLRFKANSYNLLINNSCDNTTEYKDLETITEEKINVVKKQIEYLEKMLEALNFKYNNFSVNYKNPGLEVRKEFNYILDFKNVDGIKENLGCIYLDDNNNISIDYNKFFDICISDYDKQFYSNIYLLKEKLEQTFNKKINIFKVDGENVVDFDEIIETNFYDILKEKDNKVVKQLKENKITDNELKNYSDTNNFEFSVRLYGLGKTTEEVINILETKEVLKDKKLVEETKNERKERIRNTIKKEERQHLIDLSKASIRQLKQDILNNKEIDDKVITNSYFYEDLKKAVKMNIYEDFVEELKKETTSFRTFFLHKQYVYYNNLYLEDPKLLNNTNSGREQRIVIEYFINKDGKTKKRKVIDKNIQTVKNNLEKQMNKTYTEKNVLKMINNYFNIGKEDIVNSLKL